MIIFAIPFLIGLAGCLFALVFWLYMLFECIAREPAEDSARFRWFLIVLFGNFLGAGAYYVMRRPLRIDLYGR
jgi:Phospholipase_D-nuclease N-terminal